MIVPSPYTNVQKQRYTVYGVSLDHLEQMQHLEIGYLLHKAYKINPWYPIVDHLCQLLKIKYEPCPKNIRCLDEIIKHFFMFDGVLGTSLKR